MDEKKKEAPLLEMSEAADILNRVFKDCGRRPNSVPIEALSPYVVYRKERYGIQRGMLISILAVLLLLPFLFIDARFAVTAEAAGERNLPVYRIEIQSLIPVHRVTAQVKGLPLPVYPDGDYNYIVEPVRNGDMTVEVGLINRQYTARDVDVTDVDNKCPALLMDRIQGDRVYLYVEDEGTGIYLEDAYAETGSGERIEPILRDNTKGLLVFGYPEEDVSVYIPDCIGNILQLSMTRRQ